MKLTEQNIWKNDFVTRIFKREEGARLNAPSRMNIKELANACTYCISWENPYSEELMKRSGHLSMFNDSHSEKDKRAILNKSYKYHGIQMF